MRKRAFAVAVLLALCSAGAVASAYTNYCDSTAAVALQPANAPQIKEIGTQFDLCLEWLESPPVQTEESMTSESVEAETTEETKSLQESTETVETEDPTPEKLAELYSERIKLYDEFSVQITTLEYETACKLIDYDILIKKLELMIKEYKFLKQKAYDSEKSFKVGGCDLSVVEADKKAVETKYYEIQALLSEISPLKAEIEEVTGQTLTTEFDFEQVYLITDVVKLSPESLSGTAGGATICLPDGVEPTVFEATDCTEQYNNALKLYYALGAAMREYVSCSDAVKKGEEQLKLGTLSADNLKALNDEKTAAYMVAYQAKAELAKALFELDTASGGALTMGLGVSSGRAAAYKSAVSDKQSGSGLWIVDRMAAGIVFRPVILPTGVAPDEEDVVSYTVSYADRIVSESSYGGGCVVPLQEYEEKKGHAHVTYYINGIKVGTYKVDVFSPFGEFIG